MSVASLIYTLITGYPLIFLPSYNSSGTSFPHPLSESDEKKALELLISGNEAERNAARDRLITHNMRLVAHISAKYSASGVPREDLISIGTIGLIKAISSYNAERSTRMGTYAARCIENEILMWIRKTKKEKSEISINESLGTDKEGNDIRFSDILGTDESCVTDELELRMEAADLYKAIEAELKPREKVIIIHRFGLFGRDRLTQRELAQLLGISRSYVSRIERRALLKLRRAIV